MKKGLLFWIFLVSILFINACESVDLSKVSEEDINKVIVCDTPYIRHASGCCLDNNDNKICDEDENGLGLEEQKKSETQSPPPEPQEDLSGLNNEMKNEDKYSEVCATEVVFDVTNGCKIATANPTAWNVKVVVKNDGSRVIDRFLVRSYQAADNVAQDTLQFATGVNGIPAFGIESEIYPPSYTSGTGPTKMVELYPIITIDGKVAYCSSNIKKYGDLNGIGLLGC